jgi:hypothetical protein
MCRLGKAECRLMTELVNECEAWRGMAKLALGTNRRDRPAHGYPQDKQIRTDEADEQATAKGEQTDHEKTSLKKNPAQMSVPMSLPVKQNVVKCIGQ